MNYNWPSHLIKPGSNPTTEQIVSSVLRTYKPTSPFFKKILTSMCESGIYTSAMVVSGGYTNSVLKEMRASSDLSASLGLLSGHSVRTYKKNGVFLDLLVDVISNAIYEIYKSTTLKTDTQLPDVVDGSSLVAYLDDTRKTTVHDELKTMKNRAVSISSGSEMINLDQGERFFLITANIVLPSAQNCYSTLTITNTNENESVVVSTYGEETINKNQSVTIEYGYKTIRLVSDGSNWIRI